MKKFACGLVAALTCFAAAPASAAYVVNITQEGNDVVATGSGSINLTALGNPGSGTTSGHMGPGFGYMIVGSGFEKSYSGTVTGPSSFGAYNYSYKTADSVTGNLVGFNVQNSPTSTRFILVPFYYESGTDLGTSTATYKDTDFSYFGLTAGDSYTWTWGTGADQDSFTVNVLASAVPEPAAWAMMIAGFGLTGTAMRRRRKLAVRFA